MKNKFKIVPLMEAVDAKSLIWNIKTKKLSKELSEYIADDVQFVEKIAELRQRTKTVPFSFLQLLEIEVENTKFLSENKN